MKKIGLIGGLGPESTMHYYRQIIAAFRDTYDQNGFPEMVIESLDMGRVMRLIERGSWEEVERLIGGRCESLRSAGAAFGAITSNTPHRAFAEIQTRTALPLLSIVDAVRDRAVALGLSRLCLLGTIFTMESDFYARAFRGTPISLFAPDTPGRAYIQEKLFSEIELGIIRDETRQGIVAVIERTARAFDCDGVILGCTELPLIISPSDLSIACLDTTEIHVAAIVDRCRE